jgi:hypothetical protein
MKQKYLLALSGVIVIVAVLLVALIQVRSVRSGPQASTPTPTYGLDPNATIVLPNMPTAVQPKITDLAPDIPYGDKPAVVIRHADGSLEEFLLAPGTVNAFLRNLPKGDKLELKIPPPRAMLTHEAP